MGDERYVQVRERAEAYAAWYEKERVTAHIAENCREEAKQILAQADRLMAHTFSFEDRWDMEPCREPVSYTHLDVYKRQVSKCLDICSFIPDI